MQRGKHSDHNAKTARLSKEEGRKGVSVLPSSVPSNSNRDGIANDVLAAARAGGGGPRQIWSTFTSGWNLKEAHSNFEQGIKCEMVILLVVDVYV